MAGVFPSPLRRSVTGFRVPPIPKGLDLAKLQGALAAVGKEAGAVGSREQRTPGKRDYQLKLD